MYFFLAALSIFNAYASFIYLYKPGRITTSMLAGCFLSLFSRCPYGRKPRERSELIGLFSAMDSKAFSSRFSEPPCAKLSFHLVLVARNKLQATLAPFFFPKNFSFSIAVFHAISATHRVLPVIFFLLP